MQRLDDMAEIVRHKKAFLQVRNSNVYLQKNISFTRAIMHDTVKLINVLLLGDRVATVLHRKYAGHHKGVAMNQPQKVEAFCDWECARFTKPAKPLDGVATWQKYYADVDMAEVIKGFKGE